MLLKNIKIILLNLIFGLLLGACSSSESQKNNSENDKVKGFLKKKTAKVTIRYAQTFRVEYFENYKLLTLLNPQQPTAPAQQFVLLPRGTAAPAGFASEQIVEIPIRRLIPLSHTHIACAMVLGVDSTIVAVNEAEYLPEEKILQKIAQRTIQNLGSGAELNSELVLSLRPDLIMTGGGADMKPYQAFLKAGIKVIPNADWLENSPLGRAESIKLLALFYDQEAQAEAKFRDIEAKYLSIKNLAKRATTRPQVLCDIPYKTTWYVPGGQSFFAQLLADARAKYHWHHTTSTASLPIDFEAVYPVALQSDYWLNLSVYKTKAEVLAQDRRFAAFKAFKNGQLYNNNRQATTKGGNTYYMWGIVNPDLILSDLVKIFHPELLPDYQLIYYQKIE